jgi:hypothetical protein
MRRMALAVLGTAWLQASCSPQIEPETFYVVVAPNESEQYYVDMIGVVALARLDPNPGSTSDGRGATLYVVDGRGRGVRVWSVNMPLSERESLACGGPRRPRIDPTQFIVTVTSRGLFGGAEVSTVSAELQTGLLAKGYEVRPQPRRCAEAILDP